MKQERLTEQPVAAPALCRTPVKFYPLGGQIERCGKPVERAGMCKECWRTYQRGKASDRVRARRASEGGGRVA